MDESDRFALAALIIAIVALLNTVLQALQQYYATAEGFRKCGPAGMGGWARFTHRKFRWREFRFETVFATPIISLVQTNGSRRSPKGHVMLLGTNASYERSLVTNRGVSMKRSYGISKGKTFPSVFPIRSSQPSMTEEGNLGEHGMNARKSIFDRLRKYKTDADQEYMDGETVDSLYELISSKGSSSDLVSWIPLMQVLHEYGSVMQTFHPRSTLDTHSLLFATVRPERRSWDNLPPDIMRPFAQATTGDIALMMQLLGLKWTIFAPDEGKMRAEGSGRLVTSADFRGIGALISFFTESQNGLPPQKVCSNKTVAAPLGFGLVPISFFTSRRLKVGNLEEIQETIALFLYPELRLVRIPDYILPTLVTEIVGLVAPIFIPHGTKVTRILKPTPLVRNTVLSLRGSLEAFSQELEALYNHRQHRGLAHRVPSYYPGDLQWSYGCLHQIEKLRDQCRKIQEQRDYWQNGKPVCLSSNDVDPGLLEVLDESWSMTSEWFPHEGRHFLYLDNLTVHISTLLLGSIEKDSIPLSLQKRPFGDIGNVLSSTALRGLSEEIDQSDRQKLMSLYFDISRSECIAKSTESHVLSEEDEVAARVEVEWITMMFRGICWHALHWFNEEDTAVPSRHYDSKLPIYIG